MQTIEFVKQADEDKILRMNVPVEEPLGRYHVVLMIEPESHRQRQELDQWPAGFFDRTAGKWIGELERPLQGEYEKQEAM